MDFWPWRSLYLQPLELKPAKLNIRYSFKTILKLFAVTFLL